MNAKSVFKMGLLSAACQNLDRELPNPLGRFSRI
jgi:hypothetical protein